MNPVVMVPLDGSPAAEAALPLAIHLAKRANSAVRLVGAHAPPAVLLDGETLIGSVIPDDSIRERETEYFANVQYAPAQPGAPSPRTCWMAASSLRSRSMLAT